MSPAIRTPVRACTVLSFFVATSCGPGRPEPDETASGSMTSSTTATSGSAATTVDDATVTGSATSPATSASDGGETGDTPCCAPQAEPTSTVEGTTVRGPVTTRWAWYGITGGECGGRFSVFLYADPLPSKIGSSNVGTYLLVTIYQDDWPNGFQGIGPAFVEIAFQTKTAATHGELTIHRLDQSPVPQSCQPGEALSSDGRFIFSLSVEQVDWDVHGDVSAVYCPACNVFCP